VQCAVTSALELESHNRTNRLRSQRMSISQRLPMKFGNLSKKQRMYQTSCGISTLLTNLVRQRLSPKRHFHNSIGINGVLDESHHLRLSKIEGDCDPTNR
jgi:hypothetical protein